MNFEEFKELIKEIASKNKFESCLGYIPNQGFGSFPRGWGWDGLREDDQLVIYVDWETGGASGGGYWDGAYAESYRVDCPDEKQLDLFDKVMEEFLKNGFNVNFTVYKKLYDKLIKDHDHSSSDDYYGNYTDYSGIYVDVQDWYDALKELELL